LRCSTVSGLAQQDVLNTIQVRRVPGTSHDANLPF